MKNKRIPAALLALVMVLLAACSAGQTPNGTEVPAPDEPAITDEAKTFAGETIDLLVFRAEGEKVKAMSLAVDLDCMVLSVGDTVYICGVAGSPYSEFEPRYMSSERLVLPCEPDTADFPGNVETAADKTLWFEDCTLTYGGDGTFSVSRDGEDIAEGLSLEYEGLSVTPAAFYLDGNGDIVLLGSCTGDMMSTCVVSLIYTEDGGKMSLLEGSAYPNEWNDFGGQLTLPGPVERATASPELDGFLLNEGRGLFLLSASGGTAEKLLSDEDIGEALPYLDTHRESYAFFYDFGYQNVSYAATFNTYNSVPGMYAVFYSAAGEYEGYLLCNEAGVTLYDASNAIADTIEMRDLLPLIYIPDAGI